MREKDCDFLGMNRPITRRDFLDGIGIAIGGALATGAMGQTTAPPSYPPAQEGLRGSHAGSFEVAHRLRDRQFFQTAGPVEETGENYDLVVIGGGISGLSAAYFFRKQAGPGARILIIDNHDDFGGHAKRNEFQVGDRTLIDGLIVNGSARVVGWFSTMTRTLQTGYIYHYAFTMILAVAIYLGYLLMNS